VALPAWDWFAPVKRLVFGGRKTLHVPLVKALDNNKKRLRSEHILRV
jgi:hypothetical protein